MAAAMRRRSNIKLPEHESLRDEDFCTVLKAKFRELDTNRDGMLDKDELGAMLKRGRPDITDREIRGLFLSVDRDSSGRVIFEEFVDFLFAPPTHNNLPSDIRIPLFTPSMKKLQETAAKKSRQAHEVTSVELCGGIWCVEQNGLFERKGFMNDCPRFARTDSQAGHLFYGWTEGRRRIGWFVCLELPHRDGPVRDFELFNPSPFADTPDRCCASWETCGGNRDKRLFCQVVDIEQEPELNMTLSTVSECLDSELWPLQAEAEPVDVEEEAGWDAEPGEDLEDFEGLAGGTWMFEWSAPEEDGKNPGSHDPPDALKVGIESDAEFCDPEFPPNEDSLGYTMGFHDLDRSEAVAEEWTRLRDLHEKVCLFYQVGPDDIHFGGDRPGMRWLLSACAAVAEYPAWVQSMFGVTTALSPSGRYAIRLYHPGRQEFIRLSVDDAVPTKGRAPVFAGVSMEGEIWVALIEKAFAKFCGSYAKLEGGTHAYGLLYLCGGRTAETWTQAARGGRWIRSLTHWRGKVDYDVNLRSRRAAEGVEMDNAAKTVEQIWSMLRRACDLCYPVMCSTNPATSEESGLEPDRGYSLIAAREVEFHGRALRMVFLRNPFGISEWQGRWSDNSVCWKTAPMTSSALRFRPSKDGAFWMSFRDFLRHFQTIDLVRKSMPAQGCHTNKLADLKARIGAGLPQNLSTTLDLDKLSMITSGPLRCTSGPLRRPH